MILQCNVSDRGLLDVVDDIRARLQPIVRTLPAGYFVEFGGQFENQRAAERLIGVLFAVSLLGVFLVLYTLFRSTNLALQVLMALPMAFIGSVLALSGATAAFMMKNAGKVIIVPGYGMAVAQAQHVVKELADLLEANGAEVSYAIHPVAGRMPGHMNVLLAEANVPYEQLVEPGDVNPNMEIVDVAVVIGANDVVNPAARTDEKSPIYGMPIIDADKAHTVLAIKRSMNPGFAGIENELYYSPNTLMLFGDAKQVIGDVVKEISGEGSGH